MYSSHWARSCFGQVLTEVELKDMMIQLDDDGDNQLSFVEFIGIIERQMEQNDMDKEEFMAVFKICDYDGSGQISTKELHGVLTSFGENFTLEELQEVMMDADIDGND